MCEKIYANLENLASEQIYALLIYVFLSIKIKQHLLLLTDCRYISIPMAALCSTVNTV